MNKQREAYKKSYSKRYYSNKEMFVKLKGNKCSSCQNMFPLCCYDFHHINPSDKKNRVIQWHARSIKYLERELKNCILLCANCHRILHKNT